MTFDPKEIEGYALCVCGRKPVRSWARKVEGGRRQVRCPDLLCGLRAPDVASWEVIVAALTAMRRTIGNSVSAVGVTTERAKGPVLTDNLPTADGEGGTLPKEMSFEVLADRRLWRRFKNRMIDTLRPYTASAKRTWKIGPHTLKWKPTSATGQDLGRKALAGRPRCRCGSLRYPGAPCATACPKQLWGSEANTESRESGLGSPSTSKPLDPESLGESAAPSPQEGVPRAHEAQGNQGVESVWGSDLQAKVEMLDVRLRAVEDEHRKAIVVVGTLEYRVTGLSRRMRRVRKELAGLLSALRRAS